MDRLEHSDSFPFRASPDAASHQPPVRPLPRERFAGPEGLLAFSASAPRTTAASGLSAGTVPGRIDFLVGDHVGATGSLPMYRHPADRNAAATLVELGRRIDVRG